MNVALFFTYQYSLSTWKSSGILDKEIEIYKELHEKYAVQFTFITYGNSEDIDLVKKYKFINVLPVYAYIKKSNFKYLNYLKSFLIPFKLKHRLQNVDLIKQHQLLGSWVSILQKILIKKPLIIRTGYDMYIFSKKEGKNLLIRFLYFLLTFFSLKFCDLYTVSSNSDLSELKQIFNSNKFKVRRNWIKNVNKNSDFDKRYNKKILSVGRIEKQKNYEYSIKSLKNTGYSLDIVGDGSNKFTIQSLAKIEGVEVNFLGVLENAELQKKYQQYKYLLMPSYYEGNPKVLIEAMSNGCVVIASKINNITEIIDGRTNGILIDIYDKKNNLKEILYKLEKDNSYSKEISKGAINFIEKYYLLSNLVEKEFLDYKYLIR